MRWVQRLREIDWFGGEPPIALRIVALLVFLNAVLAAIDMLFALFRAELKLNFGVLGFWSAPGLLRYRSGWRLWVMLSSWIGVAMLIFVVLVLFVADMPGTLNIGPWSRPISDWLVYPMIVKASVEPAFILWVLSRPSIRSRFLPMEQGPAGASA